MRTENERLKMKRNVSILLLSFFMAGTIFFSPLFALTAKDQVAILIQKMDDFNLDDYVDHRLFVKLDVVEKSLEAGHYKPAIENMNTFKTEVGVIQKISDKTGRNFLTKDQADFLLKQANLILVSISNTTTAASIGTSGGSISVSDSSLPITGASVEVPQDALTSDTVITITRDDTVPAMPSNFSNAGPAVDFGPSGLFFSLPVTISVPYNPKSDVSKLKLLSFSGDQWTEDSVTVTDIDTAKKLIYARVKHFSTYQAAEETGDPGAPVFNWIDLWNINSAGKNVIAMGCSVTDPNGPDQLFMPNNISNLTVKAPDGSIYYQFIEGDWTYNWASKKEKEYYWRWILLSTPPPEGTYTFSVTDVEGKTTEQSKTLTIDPIPAVDYRTVKISSDNGATWISQVQNGGFEQVALTGQSLWIKWDLLTADPSKTYYYRVHIRNRTHAVLLNTTLSDGPGNDRVMIPIEVLNTILHDRSFYRIRIEVFDTGNVQTASNKSESQLIPFTTGDLKLSDPVIDWAVVYRNTYCDNGQLYDHVQVNFALIGSYGSPDARPNRADVTAINVTMPDRSVYINDFNYGNSNNNVNFYLKYQLIPATSVSTGRVLFKATYLGNDYFFEDFFNLSRTISPPTLIFGSDNELTPLSVPIPTESNPLTLTWNASLSAKSYEVRIDEVKGPNNYSTVMYSPSWITPVLENGENTEVSYTLPTNSPILSTKTYRWLVRAYDGTALGDTDGRGTSCPKYFKVQ